MFYRGQISKLFSSHFTSGSETESLLQVESCPKSVSLRTEVVGGKNPRSQIQEERGKNMSQTHLSHVLLEVVDVGPLSANTE